MSLKVPIVPGITPSYLYDLHTIATETHHCDAGTMISCCMILVLLWSARSIDCQHILTRFCNRHGKFSLSESISHRNSVYSLRCYRCICYLSKNTQSSLSMNLLLRQQSFWETRGLLKCKLLTNSKIHWIWVIQHLFYRVVLAMSLSTMKFLTIYIPILPKLLTPGQCKKTFSSNQPCYQFLQDLNTHHHIVFSTAAEHQLSSYQ